MEELCSEFKIGDVVKIIDSMCNILDEAEPIERQITENNYYKIIDITTDELSEELLYTIQDIKTNITCAYMVDEWQIEKAN